MTPEKARPWNGPLYDTNCNPVEQQAVQDRLDEWYVKDGRYRPDHPMHHLYTGLADKYGAQEAAK